MSAGRRSAGRSRVRQLYDRVTGAPGELLVTLRRAESHAGHEREVVLLVAKSTVAAVVSWQLANLLGLSAATFAPFSALLVVQSTIYRSVVNSLRLVVSVLAGVLVAGAVGPLLGVQLGSFALLIFAGLLIGQWNRLGSQGSQVPVAAIFAYSYVSSGQSSVLGDIVVTVLLGAAVGVAVNLLIAPPMRYRDAAQAVLEMSRSIREVLADVAVNLRRGVPSTEDAEDWMRRTRNLDQTLSRARSSIEHGVESMRLNPRRLLMSSSDGASFDGYRTTAEALGRAGEQIRSVTYELTFTACDEQRQGDRYGEFLSSYAELLDSAVEAIDVLGRPVNEDGTGYSGLDEHVRRGREIFRRLAEQVEEKELDSPDQWPTYGALITNAERLLEEFDHAQRWGSVPLGSESDRRAAER
jgi:hypothetical protein